MKDDLIKWDANYSIKKLIEEYRQKAKQLDENNPNGLYTGDIHFYLKVIKNLEKHYINKTQKI